MNAHSFRIAYIKAMAEQAPRMCRELKAAGTLEDQVQETTDDAMRLYRDVISNLEKQNGGPNRAHDFMAREVVFAELIQFPPDGTTEDDEDYVPPEMVELLLATHHSAGGES